jgi:hypothetical protein
MAKMETVIDFHDPKFASRPSVADNQQITNAGKEEGPAEETPQPKNTDKVVEKKRD